MLSSAARHLARAPRRLAPIAQSVRPLSAAAAPLPKASILPANAADRETIFADFDDVGLRSELNKLRDIENDLVSTVSATSPAIDWDHWKAQIKYPGLIDQLKQVYDSVPVADVEGEMVKARKQVDEVFDPIIKQYDDLAKQAEEDTVRVEKQIEEITFLRDNIQTLTVDEFLEKYPTIKKSIEDDVKNNKWFIDAA